MISGYRLFKNASTQHLSQTLILTGVSPGRGCSSVFHPLPVEDEPPDIPEAMRAVRCVISCKARREMSGD